MMDGYAIQSEEAMLDREEAPRTTHMGWYGLAHQDYTAAPVARNFGGTPC